tara:strand:- start:436 stop:756 length:321 start_codon:yes stop_codon:yes gene_type:complete
MKLNTDRIFKAIADPTRREIFRLLVMGSALSITQLSSHFEISRQGIRKHLQLLTEAEMVKIQKEGREQICYAEANSLQPIKDWISYYDKFWDNKLNSLEDYLDGSL